MPSMQNRPIELDNWPTFFGKRIVRVFPRLNSQTPRDRMAFVGIPPLSEGSRPEADEVHVSVTFTRDRATGEDLAERWSKHYDDVRLGGPAFDDPGGEFTPGLYVRRGVTFTSRGCNNNCWFCFVPKRSGKIRPLKKIVPGYRVQDDNLLQCPYEHVTAVFNMLRAYDRDYGIAAMFCGGIEAKLVTPRYAELFHGIRIGHIYFAYDRPGQLEPLRNATRLLQLPRRKLRCYVLCGQKGDTFEKAERRLRDAWNAGTFPFAMYYLDEKNTQQSHEWKRFCNRWSMPGVIARREGGSGSNVGPIH